MKINFKRFELGEAIPARDYLKNKKLVKYFNRETAAAVVCLAELLGGNEPGSDTPFYYETGMVEYEDYGLDAIVKACTVDGVFSQKAFVEEGMSSISPLTQFKILLNMTPSFLSIEHKLTGDNAVIYSSASGLVNQCLFAPGDSEILAGSGKVYSDGSVESAFAIITKNELRDIPEWALNGEGIELFRILTKEAHNG